MTEVENQELREAYNHLSYWQRQLRLDHMDFEIIIANAEEFGDKLGTCTVAPSRHCQKIVLRHPEDRSEKDKSVFRRDPEVVIVHELLHTKEFPWRDHPAIDEPFKKDNWLVQLHEDSLDAIAEALVRVRRRTER